MTRAIEPTYPCLRRRRYWAVLAAVFACVSVSVVAGGVTLVDQASAEAGSQPDCVTVANDVLEHRG